MKKWKIVAGASVVVVVLACAMCGGNDNSNSAASEAAATEAAAPIEYVECKAADLLKEQKENGARAKKAYEDKYLSIEGVFVKTDDNGTYFELAEKTDFVVNSIKCEVNTEDLKNQMLELNKGDKLTVKGKCTDVSGGFRTYEIDVTEIVKH